nr:hypothetical protein [Tanacetum cinerariifolium]
MRARSSSNLYGEASPNPTSLNLKRRNRRRSKQPFILKESLVDTMADQRTMAELLRAPTEGYAEAIVVPSILAEQFELKHSVNTPQSGKDILELNELMELCTKLQQRKLERRKRSRTHGLKRLYKVGLSARVKSSKDEGLGEEDASIQGRISDINADEDITLVSTHDDAQMFDADKDLHGEKEFVAQQDENVVEKEVDAAQVQVTTDATILTILILEATLAQALAELKHAKPKTKAKGIVFYEPEESTTITTTTTIPKPKSQDKGKAKMIKEHVKLKKKDQIQLDKEVVLKLQDELQAEFVKEQRLAKEQQELNGEEKAKLFMQLLEKRRKFFAVKRAEEKRNRPPTKAQQMSIVCTYLKNMDGWKLKSLKKKLFAKTQELFDKAMKKRARDELEQERSKKKKVEDDKESKELKIFLEIIPDNGDDVTIDATPLSSNKMLKIFDRKDLEVLFRLVKARFEKVKLVDHIDSFLLHNLKTMFEHHVEDNVWKNQQGLVKVKNWKLYDSYGVHCVKMQNILYYLLVEKMYPLTHYKLHQMFNDVKLQVDYECEMAYELLILVKKQLKEGYAP